MTNNYYSLFATCILLRDSLKCLDLSLKHLEVTFPSRKTVRGAKLLKKVWIGGVEFGPRPARYGACIYFVQSVINNNCRMREKYLGSLPSSHRV